MNRNSAALFAVLTLGLLAGCDRGAKEPIAVFKTDADTVLVRVGETAITAGDFRNRFDYEMGIFKFTMRYATTRPNEENAKKRLAAFERSRLERVLPQLVHCALLNAYLKTQPGGLSVTNGEDVIARALKHFGAKARRNRGKKAMPLEEFAQEIGVSPDTVREQLLVESREAKARACFEPSSLTVTEKEIDEGLARLDAYAVRAAATNRLIWVTCSNALAQVRAGADFVAVAKAFKLDEQDAKDWGSFNRQELEDAVVRKWAFSAKVGEIGGPFDFDEGVSILKVTGHAAGTEVDSMASQGVEEVRLARLSFPLVDEHPEPHTREHCRTALLRWKANETQKRLFGKLFKETKIEYPHGDKMDLRRD